MTDVLVKKIERQKRQIELLEQLIEDRSRDMFQASEELQRNVDELQATQRQLVDASRRAGMAEVATNVLHNVGNALNSVNVSSNVIASIARSSKAHGIGKAVALLRAQPDPGKFINEDPRGKKLIDYLEGIGRAVEQELAKHAEECSVLEKNIDHIRSIVTAQQNLAKAGPLVTAVSLRKKVADVIAMANGALKNSGVEVSTSFDVTSDEIVVDRHKLFEILLNLITNAAHALRPRSSDRRLEVRVFSQADKVVFEVKDNGVGISAENLTKIFCHGFTTKSDGHGFGLHSCANAAREMGGRLEGASEGPGLGATFTLVLPRAAATSASRPGAAFSSP